MNNCDVLNNLQKRNNSLNSKLVHEKLKYGNFSLNYYKKYSLLVINEFKQNKSLCKSALNLGINPRHVLKWYVQGQLNNPEFRGFYLAIRKLSESDVVQTEEPKAENIDGDYSISEYGDGWSYKTFINGEKIFIISDTLDGLKSKIKSKKLPLD